MGADTAFAGEAALWRFAGDVVVLDGERARLLGDFFTAISSFAAEEVSINFNS